MARSFSWPAAGLSTLKIHSRVFKWLSSSKLHSFLYCIFHQFLILHLSRRPTHNCIAFVTPRFQPPLANIFLLSLFRLKLIQSIDFPDSFPHALEQDSELGPHTDIMLFSFNRSSSPITSMMCDKYVLWNNNMQPYGNKIPFLCPTCTSVWPWGETIKEKGGGWITHCSNPDCGLNAEKSQFQPRAKVSGEKPEKMTFITPTNRRTHGWFSFRVVPEVKATVA